MKKIGNIIYYIIFIFYYFASYFTRLLLSFVGFEFEMSELENELGKLQIHDYKD